MFFEAHQYLLDSCGVKIYQDSFGTRSLDKNVVI